MIWWPSVLFRSQREKLCKKQEKHRCRQGYARSISIMRARLETNIEAGSQPLSSNRAELRYGVSITDLCVDWPTTERCLHDAAAALASVPAGSS